MLAVGLMSGTSLDGIDAVLCRIEGNSYHTKVEKISFITYPIPECIKDKIRLCCTNKATIDLVCSLNFEFGELLAKAVQSVCDIVGIKTSSLGFVASHGQTIYHQPKADETHHTSTLQIGESAIISMRCNCTVISNFRVMDIAAGGEGAPLVPFSEYILYREEKECVALQNIGGIGNVTIIPQNSSIDDVYAFDTGPGNMIIDEAMRQLYQLSYDKNGDCAAKGKLIIEMCDELKKHPYIYAKPPKTTGRESFGEEFTKALLEKYKNERKEDIITTCTWFTAYTIAENYKKFVLPYHSIHKVILGGGGAHNVTMRNMLQDFLPICKVTTQDDMGYSSDAKEAIAFVILGNETMNHSYSNVPNATGAKQKCILGNITLAPYKE